MLPLIAKNVKEAGKEDESDEELRENCLQTLEALVLRCPKEVSVESVSIYMLTHLIQVICMLSCVCVRVCVRVRLDTLVCVLCARVCVRAFAYVHDIISIHTPLQVTPHLDKIVAIALEYIKHDPNYAEGDEGEDMDADDNGDDDEGDDDDAEVR